MECLNLHFADIAQDMPLGKTNTWQKSLSFLRIKIWSKINPNIKNAETSFSFRHALQKNYFKANSNNYHTLTINIIV